MPAWSLQNTMPPHQFSTAWLLRDRTLFVRCKGPPFPFLSLRSQPPHFCPVPPRLGPATLSLLSHHGRSSLLRPATACYGPLRPAMVHRDRRRTWHDADEWTVTLRREWPVLTPGRPERRSGGIYSDPRDGYQSSAEMAPPTHRLAKRRTVDGGRWTVDGGRWTVDGGRRTADDGRWTVDGGRRMVDGGL